MTGGFFTPIGVAVGFSVLCRSCDCTAPCCNNGMLLYGYMSAVATIPVGAVKVVGAVFANKLLLLNGCAGFRKDPVVGGLNENEGANADPVVLEGLPRPIPLKRFVLDGCAREVGVELSENPVAIQISVRLEITSIQILEYQMPCHLC